MKAVLARMMFVMAAAAVIAPNAQAQSAETETGRPLIRMVTAGGMPMPNGHFYREVSLSTEGVLTVREGAVQGRDSRNQLPVRTLLTIHEKETMKKLKALASSFQGGELVDLNPNEQGCFDIPSTTYSVFKGGKAIDVAARHACKPYVLKDETQRDEAEKVIEFVSALENVIFPF